MSESKKEMVIIDLFDNNNNDNDIEHTPSNWKGIVSNYFSTNNLKLQFRMMKLYRMLNRIIFYVNFN